MDVKRTCAVLVAAQALATACGGGDRPAAAATVGSAQVARTSRSCVPFSGLWTLRPRDDSRRVYGGTAHLALRDGTDLYLQVEATLGDLRQRGAALHNPTHYTLTVAGESAPLLSLDGEANVIWSKFAVGRIVDDAAITGPRSTSGSLHADGMLQVLEGFLVESLLVGALCLE
jgi:hypothetical protein